MKTKARSLLSPGVGAPAANGSHKYSRLLSPATHRKCSQHRPPVAAGQTHPTSGAQSLLACLLSVWERCVVQVWGLVPLIVGAVACWFGLLQCGTLLFMSSLALFPTRCDGQWGNKYWYQVYLCVWTKSFSPVSLGTGKHTLGSLGRVLLHPLDLCVPDVLGAAHAHSSVRCPHETLLGPWILETLDTSWAPWLEHRPGHQQVVGLIPGQGAYLGCGFDPTD